MFIINAKKNKKQFHKKERFKVILKNIEKEDLIKNIL